MYDVTSGNRRVLRTNGVEVWLLCDVGPGSVTEGWWCGITFAQRAEDRERKMQRSSLRRDMIRPTKGSNEMR